MHLAFPQDANSICLLSAGEIKKIIEKKRSELARYHYRLPNAEALWALLFVLRADRLTSLVLRHTAPSHVGHFGTSDLFLYAINQATGMPCMHPFVEVKRPSEPVSDDQKAEITFLRKLGLKARILRLIERG
jgi:hypothetical protein